MSLIRGVLLAGMFRTQHELNGMTNDDQRNTLIVGLHNLSNQSIAHYQGMDDDTLAGAGTVLAFLRQSGIRNDNDLKRMSDDDQRNTLIVELDAQTNLGGPTLQGMSNMELILHGLGKVAPGSLNQSSFLRGVLLAGKFRSQHELDNISEDNQRNTLIVELSKHSNQSNYQSFNDFDLAGMGAALVFLRASAIRNDSELKNMSADDQRNTLIVEINAQTHIDGGKLQGLRNMDLIRLALGVDPKIIFKSLPDPLQPPDAFFAFSINNFEILTQKADSDHSDSDWLSFFVLIVDSTTRSLVDMIHTEPINIEGNIKTGDNIRGVFESGPLQVRNTDEVSVSYVLTNLGSSSAEDQLPQAVQITSKIVELVGPIAGAVIEDIARTFDGAVSTVGDIFDFFDIHLGPPNCNGEVLHDTVNFVPNELQQAVNKQESKEFTGTQTNDRCGAPPQTRVHWSIRQL